MNSSELEKHSIASLAMLIKDKVLSPVELVEATLARIDLLNPALNAYITVSAEQATAAAKSAEAEIASGRYRGPLHGIPVAHKDVLLSKGIRTTAHSKTLKSYVPDEDAATVERLSNAGAVLMGKLNTYEFACGGTEHFGVPVNPWDTSLTTGGSSAGAGSSIAARLCFGATGTDTGGSIRGPASYCGVIGLKPSYGRVSRHGLLPLSWSLDHVGPLTRTAVDAAVMLEAMAGFDARDPSSSRTPIGSYVDAVGGLDAENIPSIAGLKVGVPHDWLSDPATEEISRAVEAAIAELEGAGAQVVPIELPRASHSLTAVFAIMCPEATTAHTSRLCTHAEAYASFTRQTLLLGACLDATSYIRGQQMRHEMYREIEATFQHVDALVWPTTHQTAPPVDRPETWAVIQTQLSNLTGHPSISVPCGYASTGAPIGMLITGRMFDEETILKMAAAYQSVTSWHEECPQVSESYRPPESKPYAFASLVGQANAGERDALMDNVIRALKRADFPVIEEDVEPLAATLQAVRHGISAMSGSDESTLEPLVHQHIEHVPI